MPPSKGKSNLNNHWNLLNKYFIVFKILYYQLVTTDKKLRVCGMWSWRENKLLWLEVKEKKVRCSTVYICKMWMLRSMLGYPG